MEEWRDIAGYEGLYQVSNHGRIRSLDRYVPHRTFGTKFCQGHVMVAHKTNSGYLAVNLCKDNKYKTYDIHRLVAMAFIPKPEADKDQINHKDENKENNAAGNLEWCTCSYNNTYGTRMEKQIAKQAKAVQQCDLNGNVIQEFISASEAERTISGKFTGAISHCLNGKTKTAYGYIWKFKEVT